MHEMPDTEHADAAAERFWPEGYKEQLHERVARVVTGRLTADRSFENLFQRWYVAGYGDYDGFVGRIAGITAIGAENGTDRALDEIHAALGRRSELPAPRLRARYLSPEPVDDELRADLRGEVVAEYRTSHAFAHLHEDHYRGALDFVGFVEEVAQLVAVGAANGADDALGAVYDALLTASPLPPARRRPRRIR